MIDFCPICGKGKCEHIDKVNEGTHELVLIHAPLPMPSGRIFFMRPDGTIPDDAPPPGLRMPQPDGTEIHIPPGESPADDKYLKAWEEKEYIDPSKVDLRRMYLAMNIVAKLRKRK